MPALSLVMQTPAAIAPVSPFAVIVCIVVMEHSRPREPVRLPGLSRS